jgi:hypothetical protein
MQKNVSRIIISEHQKLSFLHGTRIVLSFPKTCVRGIECLDVHVKFNLIFLHSKMCFHITDSYASVIQIGFPGDVPVSLGIFV